MIAGKKIVLVVGAGVSHEFEEEMRTGRILFKNILDRVNEKKEIAYLSNILDGLKRFGVSITSQDRIRFSEEINKYKNAQESKELSCSIDDFLNNNKNNYKLWTIGTFAIAFHILGYEGACKLPLNKEKSWLDELNEFIVKHRLNTWSDRLVDFKIVTFNYDRLIEEFLHQIHLQAIEKFINNSLAHVYHQVSPLPWQKDKMKSNEDFLVFGHRNNDVEKILESRDNIILMYQQRAEKNPYLEKAKKFISNAVVILFLGYGYDDYNNKNLGLMELEGKTFIANYFVSEWNAKGKGEFEEFKNKTIWDKHRNQSIYTTETCTNFIRYWLNKAVNF